MGAQAGSTRWTPCRQQLLFLISRLGPQGQTQRELDELIGFVERAKRTGTGGLVVATINEGLAAGGPAITLLNSQPMECPLLVISA